MTFTDRLQAALSLLGNTDITINREGESPVVLHPDRTISIDGRRVPVTEYVSPEVTATPARPNVESHALSEDGADIEIALRTALDDKARLEHALAIARSSALSREQDIRELKDSIAELRNAANDADSQLVRVLAEREMDTKRAAELAADRDSIQVVADERQTRILELEAQLEAERAENAQVLNEQATLVASTRHEADQAQEVIAELTDTITELASKRDSIQAVADERQTRILELEAHLERLDASLAHKDTELGNTYEQLKDTRAQLENEHEHARNIEEQLASARQTIEEGNVRQVDLERRLDDLTNETSNADNHYQVEVAKGTQRIHELEAQLEAERAENAQVLNEQATLVASTRHEADQAQEVIAELTDTITELRNAASVTDSGFTQALAERDAATTELAALASNRDSIQAVADERQTRILELEAKLDSEQDAHLQTAAQVSTLTQRLERAESTIRSLKADIPTDPTLTHSTRGLGSNARPRETDDKEGDRRRHVMILAIAIVLIAGLALFMMRPLTDPGEPAPHPPSISIVPDPTPPHPTSTRPPSPTPSPTEEESPTQEPSSEPAPEPATTPAPPVTRAPAPTPAPAPPPATPTPRPTQAPAPRPTQAPAPAPVAGHVTNLSASVSSSGSSVTVSATVTTSGPMTVTVSATVGGVSVPMGTRQVNGTATFTGSASVPAGTHAWRVIADGLVNSGTITTF